MFGYTPRVIHATATGVVIDVRVIPRARKTELAGTRQGALLVRLNAPPVDGAANEALIRFLAGLLNVTKSSVRIVSGEKGREKRLAADGVSPAEARARLQAAGEDAG